MALFKYASRTIALGFLLIGSAHTFAQADAPLKSILVQDKAAPASAAAEAVAETPELVPADPTPQASPKTVWFGDTPAQTGTDTLKPQPTPIGSIENRILPNSGEPTATPPTSTLPAPPQANALVLDALGVTTSETAAGPRIRGVIADGIANQIGIQPGDVITSVQGNEVYSKAELVQQLRAAVRKGEAKIPLVGIRTGRPFMVSANAEQLRQAARERSNPPARVQSMSMEPQVVRGNNPVGRAAPSSETIFSQPIEVSQISPQQPGANVVLPTDPVLPLIANEQIANSPTQPTNVLPEPQRPQAPVQPQLFPYDTAPSTTAPPPLPIAVTASPDEPSADATNVLRPKPTAQQPIQQQAALRTVRLPNGQVVQVREGQPTPNPQVIRRPLFGPMQQRPLLERPVNRVLVPVRRFFGR